MSEHSFTSLIVIAFGMLWTICSVYSFIKHSKIKKWPSADGKIISASINKDLQFSGGKNDTLRTVYTPFVEYEYTVNRIKYSSSSISNKESHTFLKESKAKNFIQKFFIGKIIAVRFSPEDPAVSHLKLEKEYISIITFVAGILICLGGLFLFFRDRV